MGILARATANMKNTGMSTAWDPSTPVPSGYTSTVLHYSLPINAFSNLSFTSEGTWAKGTLSLQIAGAALESYDEAQREKQSGVLEISVEARYNSEELYNSHKIVTLDEDGAAGIALKTPNKGPMAAALSFHITYIIPPTLLCIERLYVSATRFRVIGNIAPLTVRVCEMTTTDAPIHFHTLRASTVLLKNMNRLDPNKTSLKMPDPLVSGTYAADRITIECENGAVQGEFISKGKMDITTTVHDITGKYSSKGPMKIKTTIGNVNGTFLSQDSLHIHAPNTQVSGTFQGLKGITVLTTTCPISGHFTVGSELILSATYQRIDAKVMVVSPAANMAPPAEPTQSVLDGESPPTWEHAVNTASKTTQVTITTTEAGIKVDYLNHPRDIALTSSIKTTGGGSVSVRHPKEFEGSFAAATTLMSVANVNVAEDTGLVVEYTKKKSSGVQGYIGRDGTRGAYTGNRTEAITAHGAAEIDVI